MSGDVVVGDPIVVVVLLYICHIPVVVVDGTWYVTLRTC